MLRAGDKINDNVVLDRLIGEGAMGSVWVAHHEGLDTRVAVKFIARDHREEAQQKLLHRFEREAKAAAKIKSPHVVHMYDHGVMEGGTPYIVMELLDGETLGHRLRAHGPLDLDTLCAVVAQVGKALAAAHAHGIVHRDIKPDNIFLTPSHDELLVKVLDFGIAKHVEDQHAMTTTGAMLGTPLYMSPELIRRSRDATPAADLWALAVVAYEALCGRPPFDGETVGALFFSICGDSVTPPSAHRDGVPEALDAWFAKALCQEAELRFADARSMAAAFVEATSGAALAPLAAREEAAAGDASLGTAEFLSRAQLDDQVRSDARAEPPASEAPAALEVRRTAASEAPPDLRPDDGDRASAPQPKGGRWLLAALAAAALGSVGLFVARQADDAAPALASAAAPASASADLARVPLSVACEPACDSIRVDGRTHRRIDFADIAARDGLEPRDDELRLAVAPGAHTVEAVRAGYQTAKRDVRVADAPVREVIPLARSAGRLAEGVIDEVVARARPLFDSCHRDALKRAPVYGKLDVAFVIGLDGKVVEVHADGDIADQALRDCIAGSFKTLTFPAPEGGFVDARHALRLAPPRRPPPKQAYGNYLPSTKNKGDLLPPLPPAVQEPPLPPQQQTAD